MSTTKSARLKLRDIAVGASVLLAVVVGSHFESKWNADKFAARQQADGRQFHGYTCTQDCSGHIAGYEWAERNGIRNRNQCDGQSQSFIEGCWAFVAKH